MVSIGERLFLAAWPDDDVREKLTEARDRLGLRDGRPIPAGNLHLTLVFLGSVDPSRRACIEQAAAAVRARGFELAFEHVQWRAKTGIVWLAAAEIPAAVVELVGALHAALAGCGQEAEKRPFRAHITLARNVGRFQRQLPIAPIRWQVEDFCLVASRLKPGGSEYSVRQRWPLSTGAP